MTTSSLLPVLPFPRPDPMLPASQLARLRAEDPVVRVKTPTGEPGWLVTRYDDARSVLSDRRFTLAVPGLDTDHQGPNDSLFQDPPGHTRLRRLVSQAFTPRRLAALRPRMERIAAALVDELAAGQAPADLMEAFAFPLPITVIGELLGVPEPERESFRAWSDALLSLPRQESQDAGSAWGSLDLQVTELVTRKRAHPGDDLLSALIAVSDRDDGRLSESELVMMAITLIPAGYLTTATGTGLGVILLASHGQLSLLAEDPTLVGPGVEEVLRYQTAAGDVARVASEDLELSGQLIRAGDTVLISITSANRDERRFAEPDRFDITRTDNQHLTFGHGIHHCLGAALARLELQVAFAALAAGLPTLRLALPQEELAWRHSDLFGDDWLSVLPVSW